MSMNSLLRNTWVEIDLDQLGRNVAALREFAGRGVALAPVVKADAYGHGAVAIARELAGMEGVEYLAVGILSEALELRRGGITAPVLVLGYTDGSLLELAVENDVAVTIFEHEQADALSRKAAARGKTAHAHIKVDTGFNRLGKRPTEEFAAEILKMSALPNLALDGIFSHLRLASPEADRRQFEQFCAFVDRLNAAGIAFKYTHISDSIAAVKYREFAPKMNMIRPGAIIYGYVPKYQTGAIDVRPIMTFKTKITRVQALAAGEGVGYDEDFVAGEGAVAATIAAGYADGYPRALGNKGEVSIRGKRARVLGFVCMDQMMVEVSGIVEARPGDEAILFGPGGAEGHPSVEELAALAKANKNSIISGISRRVPRVYLRGGAPVEIVDYLNTPRGREE